ncbi:MULTISPECIES: GNAT family N-acetyltransferase [unclassified Streptomyces]|jgi:putative hemolysin|uniref:GNAT family N-acetyltransferase n=1 Tax=unclassified Streptomyces TaxID=2593676 RepID=UPI000891AC50|nr:MULTISPECIES: GNAT family N-acyltransferase [unclassified Streptomyces]MDX3768843.1 GNAT family N-acetyltransferase [Streptomyces sp. AK08-01B]MDX3815335.1 GNAT family N-acetyltransferase [Streptomyces sp. AK08-01A]SCX90430.1 Putative hemolysin [Streptomyces sp. 136MFCol5.1]
MNALPTPPLVAGPFTATPSVPQQATPTLSQAQAQAPSDRSAPPLYRVSLAVSQEDVRAAQRLRHQVFAGELGARLDGPEPGLDSDAFDAYCDHLLVREVASGDVIATYRLLPPERARIAGRLYAESEFDIGRLAPIRDDLIEVGRSCVHPAHRDGAVIALIWAGLARYMERSGHNWLAGCCSISLSDGGVLAADSWDTVRTKYLAPEEYWVTPHRLWQPTVATRPTGAAPLAGRTTARTGLAALPPLLRGYLRLGAWVCGAPAHDPDFNVADLYVLLSLRRTDPRYLRHFLSLAPLT